MIENQFWSSFECPKDLVIKQQILQRYPGIRFTCKDYKKWTDFDFYKLRKHLLAAEKQSTGLNALLEVAENIAALHESSILTKRKRE